MKTKEVKLTRRFEAHGKVFESVTVREPRWEDVMALGEPFDVQKSISGNVLVQPQLEVIAGYIRRCVVSPGFENLGELGVTDTRAVRDAVLDFFLPGGEPASSSPNPSETALTI